MLNIVASFPCTNRFHSNKPWLPGAGSVSAATQLHEPTATLPSQPLDHPEPGQPVAIPTRKIMRNFRAWSRSKADLNWEACTWHCCFKACTCKPANWFTWSGVLHLKCCKISAKPGLSIHVTEALFPHRCVFVFACLNFLMAMLDPTLGQLETQVPHCGCRFHVLDFSQGLAWIAWESWGIWSLLWSFHPSQGVSGVKYCRGHPKDCEKCELGYKYDTTLHPSTRVQYSLSSYSY